MSTPIGLTPRTRRRLVVAGSIVAVGVGWGAAQPLLTSGESVGPPYRFTDTQDDGVTPITYDPCQAVTYWVDPARQIDGGAELVAQAVAEVADATGLTFVEAGPAQAVVTIRWSTVKQEPELAGDVVGYGGSGAVRVDGLWRWNTGEIDLDAPDLAEIAASDGLDEVRGVVMHELGHVVGLDHVEDDSQLMYPTSTRTTWGNGDLQGLAQLGGPCPGPG